MSHHVANSLAVVSIFGGVMGYARKGSFASVFAGIGIGCLYAYSSYLISSNSNYGMELATGTSLILLAAMGPKAIRARKPVPIAMTSLGLIGSSYYGLKTYQQYNGV